MNKTMINGYLVELHKDFDGSTVDCLVSKDGHSGSLASVECDLVIKDGGSELPISLNDFDRMTAWAVANGY